MDIGLDAPLRDLKQRGSFDLQMTVGSKTKEPLEATKNSSHTLFRFVATFTFLRLLS